MVPSVSDALAVTTTVEPPVNVALLAGLVMLTVGDALTRSVTGAEVEEAPRLSEAVAVNE